MTRTITVYSADGKSWTLAVLPDTPVKERRVRAWAAGKGYPLDSDPSAHEPEEGDQEQPDPEDDR